MEAFFGPLRRWHYRTDARTSSTTTVTESESLLNEHVILQDLHLTTGVGGTYTFTWEAFSGFVSGKNVWMSDHVYISTDHEDSRRGYRYVLGLEELMGGQGQHSHQHPKGLYVFASPRLVGTAGAAICEFLVGLLARSETVPRVCFRCVGWVLSAPILAHFLAERQGHVGSHGGHYIKEVTLDTLYLDAEHCRVLATADSPDLKIKLSTCLLEALAVEAFCDCLQRSKGPTELYECRISAHVIARALRGNTRVTRVILDQQTRNAPGMAAMADALSDNLGLQVLDFYRQPFDDASWDVLCASLRVHPTLHRVDLAKTGGIVPTGHGLYMSDEQKIRRMNVMADMLRENTKLRTIVVSPEECDNPILKTQIRPRLVMNKYRRRFRAIQEIQGGELRRKVLGRIVGSCRQNTNLLWWLLSSNADAVFPIRKAVTGKRKRA
jgi:hypothetical protein